MKRMLIACAFGLFLASCGGGSSENEQSTTPNATEETTAPESGSTSENPTYDPNRGEGKFTDENVKVDASLNAQLAEKGEKTYDLKCASCHKLTDERLVGPGWKGVTTRHKPEWIMNFMTNTDAMLDKDPKAQAMLEICMVRMPNQNLTDDDARDILEFMRKNDGVK